MSGYFDDDPEADLDAMSFMDRMYVLQNGLISLATGGRFEHGPTVYQHLRRELLARSDLKDKIPAFVRRCRDTSQFWQFIKFEYVSYVERRQFIWGEFGPLFDYLEANERSPSVTSIGELLERFEAANIHRVWQKALDRRSDDPEGAITAARTLLESVCKHILDDAGVEYGDDNLPKLWHKCAELMNLAPSQHQEGVFKAILGNCQSIVNNVAASPAERPHITRHRGPL